MTHTRRQALKAGGAVALLGILHAAGLITAADVLAAEWNETAFQQKSLADVVKALGGSDATEGPEITLSAPEIAENGAVVLVGVTSGIANTQAIAILVERNPNTLAAVFEIPEGTEPMVKTRVKVAESSNVFALVKAGGRFYTAVKEVKVTLGGCGG